MHLPDRPAHFIKHAHEYILFSIHCRFAEELGIENWKCSGGFLQRFCLRYGVLSKKICGEGLDCPDYSSFMEEVLKPLLQEYEPQDVYNADETSLFYKLIANRTYAFKAQPVIGSKHTSSKDRLSLLLCTNMTGTDKLKPVLIGKAARPSCLRKKGVTFGDLRVDYYNNKNGWMTRVIFEHWLTKWNDTLGKQKRHVLLLIDNAPSHVTREYSNIKIQFLPPNTTAKLQPLDQGIIRICKMQYRKLLTLNYLQGIENMEEAKKIMKGFDFVVACQVLNEAWKYVSESLIAKCFSKAGFIHEGIVAPAPEHEPEPEPALERNIWDRIQRALDIEVPFEEYATADDDVQAGERLDEGDIVAAVLADNSDVIEEPGEDPDDDDSDSETEEESSRAASEKEIIHTTDQCMRIIGQMKAFALRNKLANEAMQFLSNFEQHVVDSRVNACTKQTNIRSFFTR